MDLILPLAPGRAAGLVTAVAVGVAFGFFLERAGLGSARRIAAQFYLTDLAVFKMMFTAIVVAGVGVAVLAKAGVLDLARIQVPPTWLLPQLAGGLLFGVGMIVAGLCPGTSCVAAATGRRDGLAALVGLLAGTLLFAEVFDAVRPLYDATPRGRFTLDQLLHLPWGVVVAFVGVIAAAGFLVAERIERRTDG